MCTFNWPFERDLALWTDMGVRHAGILMNKIADDPGKLKALDDAGIRISTVITGPFNLADRPSWDATWALHRAAIDMVAEYSGHSIYFPPGRTMHCDWNQDLDLLAKAAAPTVEYGRERGVIAAVEPTLRTSVSFLNRLVDAVDVAERTGLGIVADFGNNWMERDLPATLKRAMPHIALMQIGDVDIAAPAGRVHVGQGDLPLKRMIGDVLDAGYEGVFDLEVVSANFAADIDERQLRRGIEDASDLLTQIGI